MYIIDNKGNKRHFNPETLDITELTRDEKLIDIKAKRDELLKSSDFMVLPDAPYTDEQKVKILTYRQALRDLPETIDVDNPIYPILIL